MSLITSNPASQRSASALPRLLCTRLVGGAGSRILFLNVLDPARQLLAPAREQLGHWLRLR
eukprot:6198566-Pleurochrysis_carterae.AAC.2